MYKVVFATPEAVTFGTFAQIEAFPKEPETFQFSIQNETFCSRPLEVFSQVKRVSLPCEFARAKLKLSEAAVLFVRFIIIW